MFVCLFVCLLLVCLFVCLFGSLKCVGYSNLCHFLTFRGLGGQTGLCPAHPMGSLGSGCGATLLDKTGGTSHTEVARGYTQASTQFASTAFPLAF